MRALHVVGCPGKSMLGVCCVAEWMTRSSKTSRGEGPGIRTLTERALNTRSLPIGLDPLDWSTEGESNSQGPVRARRGLNPVRLPNSAIRRWWENPGSNRDGFPHGLLGPARIPGSAILP